MRSIRLAGTYARQLVNARHFASQTTIANQQSVASNQNYPYPYGVINKGKEGYPDLTKLKELQELMQREDGIPIYLKRGARDIVWLVIVGIGLTANIITSIYYMRVYWKKTH